MRSLLIKLTKHRDGGAVLRCVRDDGSETWQRHDPRYARFFPLHDLTHYAVETTLGCERGFYGLIAEGWDIPDTTGKGPRGPLPEEAILVEQIVGFVDAERAGGEATATAQFNLDLANAPATRGLPALRELSEVELRQVRAKAHALWQRWLALGAGQVMELRLDVPARPMR